MKMDMKILTRAGILFQAFDFNIKRIAGIAVSED